MSLITDSQTLADFCERLRGAPYITVDTEFLRDTTYWPKLCLVQLGGPVGKDGATEDNVAAIDALAEGLDMQPLFDLLRDESVLKVFHSGRQDMEIFYNLMGGDLPKPIFDTQVAAMVCGFGEQVGYDTLAKKLVGAHIDKSSRFADWSKRPLTDKQLNYALSDVTYLRQIYDQLKAQLERTGRARWLDEEMAILTDPATYRADPELAWLRLKTRSSDRKYLAVLREVAAWREREAQRRNVPRNRVIRDEQIQDIAAHAPGPRLRLRPRPAGRRRAGRGRGGTQPAQGGLAQAAAEARNPARPGPADRASEGPAQDQVRGARRGPEAGRDVPGSGADRRRRYRRRSRAERLAPGGVRRGRAAPEARQAGPRGRGARGQADRPLSRARGATAVGLARDRSMWCPGASMPWHPALLHDRDI